jgi:phage/plasmid-associated DNA primase
MFSANVLPRSSDDTYAYYSRWILIEFLNFFDPQKGTGDPDLDAKLQTPEELSGLLNIALAGLKRLRANSWKFSYDKTVEDVEIMYKRNANPVLAFLMDECDAVSSSYIEKTVFNNRFNDYAKKHGIRPLSPTRFAVLLKDQTEIPVSDYRPHFSGGEAAPRCWLGVRFKEVVYKQGQQTDIGGPQSTPSILLPTPSLREDENEGLDEKNSSREDRGKKNPGRGGLLAGNLGDQPCPWSKKRHCLKCGRDFPYDLGIHWKDGYICTSCHFGQTPEPAKHDPQTVLCMEGST